MQFCSHITNFKASGKVRTSRNDTRLGRSYKANMARRGIPKGDVTWYLREWMAAKGIVKQTEMMKLTGWSKATMSQLYNGTQDFNPKILREAAAALQLDPYELLMPPEKAMAILQMEQQALRVVAAARPLAHAPDDRRDKTAA